jgi:hypothetical protein
MATTPDIPQFSLDIREQVARIDKTQAELSRIQGELNKWQIESLKMRAETAKVERETRLAPWSIVFTGLGAGAALFAAGAAFTKLIAG